MNISINLSNMAVQVARLAQKHKHYFINFVIES